MGVFGLSAANFAVKYFEYHGLVYVFLVAPQPRRHLMAVASACYLPQSIIFLSDSSLSNKSAAAPTRNECLTKSAGGCMLTQIWLYNTRMNLYVLKRGLTYSDGWRSIIIIVEVYTGLRLTQPARCS